MNIPIKLTLANCQASAFQVTTLSDVEHCLDLWGWKIPQISLVLVGGASGLKPSDFERLQSLFRGLCPLLQAAGLVVIDGGTDAGVMKLMGSARTQTQSTFPLLGVVVAAKVRWPQAVDCSEDQADLEPNHSHFLLVPGTTWGEESPWIAQTASLLSASSPSVTLLINGGSIALYQDVPNSLQAGRPVIVIRGTGRAADQLAQASDQLKQGLEVAVDLQSMVESDLLHVVNLEAAEAVLGNLLMHLLQ